MLTQMRSTAGSTSPASSTHNGGSSSPRRRRATRLPGVVDARQRIGDAAPFKSPRCRVNALACGWP